MKDLGDDLERLEEPGSGPVEILVGFSEIDAAGPDGAQPVPTGPLCEEPDLALDALERKPQGKTRRTSGSAAESPPTRSIGCAPETPRTSVPPATAMSSGIQLPAVMSGESHSIVATRGRAARPPATDRSHPGEAQGRDEARSLFRSPEAPPRAPMSRNIRRGCPD
jgi:hypothetical protein